MGQIIKVGVFSEYFESKDMWGFNVWAQSNEGKHFTLKESSPTCAAAQDTAEYLLGTEFDSNWEEERA